MPRKLSESGELARHVRTLASALQGHKLFGENGVFELVPPAVPLRTRPLRMKLQPLRPPLEATLMLVKRGKDPTPTITQVNAYLAARAVEREIARRGLPLVLSPDITVHDSPKQFRLRSRWRISTEESPIEPKDIVKSSERLKGEAVLLLRLSLAERPSG